MGSIAKRGLWCPYDMGETHQVAALSDSEGSNSSLELGDAGVKCRWFGCGQWFEHLDRLASHVTRVHATSGQSGLFYCGWEDCSRGDRGFNARYKMLVHVRTHTNEKPHHCFKCDKSFSRAENLKIHARSHTGERPYVCPVPGCGKAYSNSSDRFKHTRTHSVDKPYMCKMPGCPKRYTDPSSLRKHVKTYRHFPPAEEETKPKAKVLKQESRISPQPVLEDQDTKASISEQCTPSSSAECSKPCCVQNDNANLLWGQNLFHSWMNSDMTILSQSLPWTFWNNPFPRASSCGQQVSSPDESDPQDLPLDLTIHHTRTKV